jgi:uracil-DNA glycosylase family 4
MGMATAVTTAPSGILGLVAGIRAGIATCRLCPAMRPFRKLPPESFGTTRTGYVLISEAPGPKGELFRDAAGAVLREALAQAGDEEYRGLEDLFFLTHAVRCVPSDPKAKAKTRAPKRSECGACRPYLAFELRTLHPKLVLAVGGKAAEVLGEPVVMEDEHGRRRRIGDIELLTVLVPSPHNRAALKRKGFSVESYTRWLAGLFGALIDDLRR